MAHLLELWEQFTSFLEIGGRVMLPILVVTFLMWILIVERIIYLRWTYKRDLNGVVRYWKDRTDHSSWCARQIRRQLVSDLSLKLNRSLHMIKITIALCPLLGLLGTVGGMIEVFTIMSLVGGGNARAMASGVSMATIPTMSGMVAALSGIYFASRLARQAKQRLEKAQDLLPMEIGTCAATS